MDSVIKVTSIHIIFALIASVLSAGLSLGWFGFKNDIFAGVIALVLIYIAGQICQKLYKDDIKGFSAWLWDGIAPFVFAWFIVYTLLFNYL
ncbi:hypothetical protein LJB96_01010 [Methanobrevibacter sp. OttesenSCG-928-K11]|nr:hypothetical protein [Methanobrevibacter sp. OttesenSCG-928-K11]MDL2270279.1 hypothetical protein [Methanobrevibacter sp. OttesenSCG-928-I08]